jgi:hypothetical protein
MPGQSDILHGHGFSNRSPYGAVGCEGQPRLEDNRNDAGPVEQKIRGEMLLHIVPVDVVYDERERVHEGKDKEGIGNPSVEDLESLVRNACEERDPVRFTRRCTTHHQYGGRVWSLMNTHKTNGIHAKASHPDRVASGGELPYMMSDQ